MGRSIIKYRCPHTYTRTGNIHKCTHKGRQTVHDSIKVKLKSVFTDSINLFVPTTVPHDCPTPHISPSCCTKAPPLSSFQTCPQAEQKGTYATEYARLFSAHCSDNVGMWVHYSPKEMPGLAINPNVLSQESPFPNPQNSLASLVTCTGNQVREGNACSQTETALINFMQKDLLCSLKYHANLSNAVNTRVLLFIRTEVNNSWGHSSSRCISQISSFFFFPRLVLSFFLYLFWIQQEPPEAFLGKKNSYLVLHSIPGVLNTLMKPIHELQVKFPCPRA